MLWEFIELPPFVEWRDSLFSDDEFLALQEFCAIIPKRETLFPRPAAAASFVGPPRAKGNAAERE